MNNRQATAMHEATQAIVAINLGLPVGWVSIVPGYDEEERVGYPAAVKIRDEAEQDQQLVLTAMGSTLVPADRRRSSRRLRRAGGGDGLRASRGSRTRRRPDPVRC